MDSWILDGHGQAGSELLAAATRFSFGHIGSQNPHEQIDVETRRNAFTLGVWWIVTCFGWTYSASEDQWLYEPIPGERTQEYVAATRYADRDDAIRIAMQLIADGHPNMPMWMTGRKYP